MIADAAVDAIDVCLPSAKHAAAVVPALEKGKHVFCESPLALDLGEARRMRDAARRAGHHTRRGEQRACERAALELGLGDGRPNAPNLVVAEDHKDVLGRQRREQTVDERQGGGAWHGAAYLPPPAAPRRKTSSGAPPCAECVSSESSVIHAIATTLL